MDTDFQKIKEEQMALQQRLAKIEALVVALLGKRQSAAGAQPSNRAEVGILPPGEEGPFDEAKTRYWAADEHARYLDGVHRGYVAEALAQFVRTRSLKQIRTHAQKYNRRVAEFIAGADAEFQRLRGVLYGELSVLASIQASTSASEAFEALNWSSEALSRALFGPGRSTIGFSVDGALGRRGLLELCNVGEFQRCYKATAGVPVLPLEGPEDPKSLESDDLWGLDQIDLHRIQHALPDRELLARAADATFLCTLTQTRLPIEETVRAFFEVFHAYTGLLNLHDPSFHTLQNVARAICRREISFDRLVVLVFCFHCFCL